MIHINKPKPISSSFRTLGKRCRLFDEDTHKTWISAFEYGLKLYPNGEFRVFEQTCFEYYDPLNIEIVKVGKLR